MGSIRNTISDIRLCFVVTLFFLISIEGESQMNFLPKGSRNVTAMSVLDSGNIKIKYIVNQYSFQQRNNSLYSKYDSIWYDLCAEDIHILEIGTKLSKYYSYNIFFGDSIFTDFITKNPYAQSAPNLNIGNPAITNKYFWSDYYKSYVKNTLTEYAYMPSNIPNYYYSEKMPDFNWKIQNDTLRVCGFLCQKASCTFRGKNYIAWFARGIPVSDGPWKFCGLPGLILKIYDEHNDYIFECIEIENNKKKFAITTYDYSSYKKIEREELLKLWEDIFDHYFQMVGIDLSNKFKKNPYKPLELK